MPRLRLIVALTALLAAGLLASALAATRAADTGGDAISTTPQTTTTPAITSGCIASGAEVRHHGPTTKGKVIALSFDDGPSAYTPQVLKILKANKVPATFFVIGKNIRGHESLLAQEIAAGDAIGDHTYNHVRLDKLPLMGVQDELGSTQTLIEQVTGGYMPCLFRPPNGVFNGQVEDVGRQLGMLAILWSVESKDYQRPGAGLVYSRSVKGAKPGTIMLLHDGGGNRSQTVAALPRIIENLRNRGYTFKTVPQLLGLRSVGGR